MSCAGGYLLVKRHPEVTLGSIFHVARLLLTSDAPRHQALAMFVVPEEEAAAVRAAFEKGGEFAAAVELRRRFPGMTDTVKARECARLIVGWNLLPPHPPTRLRRRPRKD
jgi:hypothetical protein